MVNLIIIFVEHRDYFSINLAIASDNVTRDLVPTIISMYTFIYVTIFFFNYMNESLNPRNFIEESSLAIRSQYTNEFYELNNYC